MVLQDHLAHAEVEEGADVEDEEEGADDGEGEDGGPGGAGVRLRDGIKELLRGTGPAHRVQLVVSHWERKYFSLKVI